MAGIGESRFRSVHGQSKVILPIELGRHLAANSAKRATSPVVRSGKLRWLSDHLIGGTEATGHEAEPKFQKKTQ